MKFYIQTLGCKVNQCESEKLIYELEQKGNVLVDSIDDSDIFIINTCTVTHIAAKKSRQMIRKSKRKNNFIKIVAMGCFVENLDDELKDELSIDLCVHNNEKENAAQIIENYFNLKTNSDLISHHKESHTRAYLKIQDGCNQFCSYCIIPYVRGRSYSIPLDKIIDQAISLSKRHSEIILTGIHMSSYGRDLKENITLEDVLDKLLSNNNISRIRLGSLEPRIITDSFMKILKKSNSFCPHFHLSLQSGSNEILSKMNRHYTAELFYEKVNLIRKYFINAAITTDIIIGFPGETDELFNETVNFVKKISFADVHLFPYSIRKGTKAAEFDKQIPGNIKTERINKLTPYVIESKLKFLEKFIGVEEEAIFEKEVILDNQSYYEGHGKYYQTIRTPKVNNITLNKRHKVFLKSLKGDILYT